jgi:hypothetical protein
MVEQVQQHRYQNVEFAPGANEGATAKLKGTQTVAVKLAVYPPDPALTANIQGLDPKVFANTGGAAMPFTVSGRDEFDPMLGGVWRAGIAAHEVGLSVTRLERIRGELIVYPRAKMVTLDFPLNAHTPAVKQGEGFKAILRQAKARPGNVAISLDTEWPAALSVSRPNPEIPSGITAVTNAGTEVAPSGGNSRSGERSGLSTYSYNLTFLDLKEPPAKIRVQVLVRSGAAKRIKFTLPDVALPDTLGLDEDADEEADPTPLVPGDPLYAKGGGRVVVPIQGAPLKGQVMMGLARLEGDSYGPWRWLLATIEKSGSAALGNIRPGRYRATLGWIPEADQGNDQRPSAQPTRIGTIVEVDIVAAGSVTLPAFRPGQTP